MLAYRDKLIFNLLTDINFRTQFISITIRLNFILLIYLDRDIFILLY